MFDSAGLEILDREECLKLIAGVPLGRIVYTDRAMPAVQPVNFALHEGAIVVRTVAGSKLTAAMQNAVVGFEADSIADDLRSGWSVSIVGHASEITDPDERSKLDELPLRSWVSNSHHHYIRITAELVSGRRILPL
ncbi:pyridoxamine 5'-phosphate oxidase family protein [Amycolatopsis anabasis]|uniref:pyridoxamine 5'-phosphate oxidase family protein n=1 Tax=Amycolatopsis anabasis TaxID=1840409 RepID=UPI00131A9172|nr:pyridoxamine 5'-phosphate oxidase family protein [Amycolatopsis anabasis]